MTTTPNMGLSIVDFDDTPWHDEVNGNFELIDSIFNAAVGVAGISGAWENSLAVTEGEKYVDTDIGSIWQVAIAHTTAATGTFEEDRDDNPTYWTPVSGALNARGEWMAGVVYGAGDLAYTEAEALYCVCAVTHTSTTSQRADIANWVILVDGSSVGDTSAVRYVAQTLTAGQKAQAKSNLSIQGAPLVTRYTTAGGPFTHTFDTACVKFRLIGGGGGGGGGGLGNVASAAATAGGSSGYVGETDFLTRGAITSGTVNVGAKGNGGVATTTPVAGSDGADTTWSDGTNSFTWGRGKGGNTVTGTFALGGVAAAKTGTLYGMSEPGGNTQMVSSSQAGGGKGGDTPYGTGGAATNINIAGNNAVGLSAGGGGAGKAANANVYNGGNGADGFLFVEEYF